MLRSKDESKDMGTKGKKTRAEDKMEQNRNRTHLDSITWWGEYDLTQSQIQHKHVSTRTH